MDLRKARRKLYVTQHDLSKAAKIPMNRLVYFETGRISLTPSERNAVLAVLRQSVRRAAEYLRMREEHAA